MRVYFFVSLCHCYYNHRLVGKRVGGFICQNVSAQVTLLNHPSIDPLSPLCAEWLGWSEDSAEEMDLLPQGQDGVLSPRIWAAPQYPAQCVCPAGSRRSKQHFLWRLWPGMVRDDIKFCFFFMAFFPFKWLQGWKLFPHCLTVTFIYSVSASFYTHFPKSLPGKFGILGNFGISTGIWNKVVLKGNVQHVTTLGYKTPLYAIATRSPLTGTNWLPLTMKTASEQKYVCVHVAWWKPKPDLL